MSHPYAEEGYRLMGAAFEYVPDLMVCSRIIAELKAVSALSPDHVAQLMNYMRITRNPVGYLIHFGPIGKLEYKRIILSEYL